MIEEARARTAAIFCLRVVAFMLFAVIASAPLPVVAAELKAPRFFDSVLYAVQHDGEGALRLIIKPQEKKDEAHDRQGLDHRRPSARPRARQ